MAEELNCIERIYTYTYDQFTVFFYGSHVIHWRKGIFYRTALRGCSEFGRGYFE